VSDAPEPDVQTTPKGAAASDAVVSETTSALFGVVAHDLAALVQAELTLNQAEHATERRQKAYEVAALFGGGLAAMLAAAAATAAAIEILNHPFANWVAALIVAGGWAVAAALLFQAGKLARLRHRFDPAGDDRRLEEAKAKRAAAEAAVRASAGRFAEVAAADAVDSIADHTVGAAEREGELLLREVAALLRAPGRAGIGVLGKLAGR
jgi:hypothetical protein